MMTKPFDLPSRSPKATSAKQADAVEAALTEAVADARQPLERKRSFADGDRSAIMVRLPPIVHQQLRIIAAETDTTLQAILLEAIQEVIVRHRRTRLG